MIEEPYLLELNLQSNHQYIIVDQTNKWCGDKKVTEKSMQRSEGQ
jgi:hypothetical protein